MGDRDEDGGGVHRPATALETFRLLVESVDEYGILMLDPDGRVLTWNRGAERLHGYTADEVVGSHVSRLYPAGTPRERIGETLVRAEREGSVRSQGWRARQDGSLFWADVTLTAVRDAGGLRGFAEVTQDHTAALRTHERLQQLTLLLSESQALTQVGSWQWDTVTNELLWSRQMYRLYGLEPTPAPGASLQGFLERVHADDRERVAEEVRRCLAERRPFSLEHRVGRPDGELRVLRVHGRPLLDEGGKALRMIGTAQDVTDLQRPGRNRVARDAAPGRTGRRQEDERLRIAADGSPAMVWMAGTDGQRDWFNRTWLAFTGRRLEQELGDGWTEGVHADDRLRHQRTCAAAFDRREAFRTEYRLRRHDGQYRWVLDSGAPRFGPAGFAGYVGCSVELGERHEAGADREREPDDRSTG